MYEDHDVGPPRRQAHGRRHAQDDALRPRASSAVADHALHQPVGKAAQGRREDHAHAAGFAETLPETGGAAEREHQRHRAAAQRPDSVDIPGRSSAFGLHLNHACFRVPGPEGPRRLPAEGSVYLFPAQANLELRKAGRGVSSSNIS